MNTQRTPILVGVGTASRHLDDPTLALEPIALMAEALRNAADDCSVPSLIRAAQSVAVPKGMWGYRDPARILIEKFSMHSARSMLVELGVLQTSPFVRACRDIQRGALDVAVVVGGEAKFRALRAAITATDIIDTGQPDDTEPDEYIVPSVDVLHPIEIARGLPVPARQYAIIESAMRAADGLGVADHAQRLNNLWSGFSAVAVNNDDAWNRTLVGADVLAGTSANPLLAAPYTKLHCSQWNVDQAAAFILCSVATAERHNVPRDRWVFPHAIAESNFMTPVVQRREMFRSPAMRLVGEAIASTLETEVHDIEYLDLYSCFPAAVQLQMREMNVTADRQLTLTGGMTFGGGPLNNYSFQSLAKLVGALRADPGSRGIATAVSGMVTKFGASAWSTMVPAAGCEIHDVSDAARSATEIVDVHEQFEGRAIVAGYTVAYDKGHPFQAIAVIDTPEGLRSIAQTMESSIVREFIDGTEWIGRPIIVDGATITAT